MKAGPSPSAQDDMSPSARQVIPASGHYRDTEVPPIGLSIMQIAIFIAKCTINCGLDKEFARYF
jgi:hypothetical protein